VTSFRLHRPVLTLSSLLLLTLPLRAATSELDPLAREVAAFSAAAAPAAKTSLTLSQRIAWSEDTARHEREPAKREELLDRLAALRAELAAVARRVALDKAGDGGVSQGSFSGRVTDDGEPVAGARIQVFDQDGFYRDLAIAGADGRYAISLPVGTYYLYAAPPSDLPLSPQLFAGISCFMHSTCAPTDGTPLELVSGASRTADFALEDLGAIEGRVRRQDDQAPVDTEVWVYDRELEYLGRTHSVQGSYRLGGLPPGDYWLVALGQDDLAGMIYDGIVCETTQYNHPIPCPTAAAAAVRVKREETVAGIDFDLLRGASLQAAVVDGRTGEPIEVGADFQVFDATGTELRRIYVEAGTGEAVAEGLAGGIYYASVQDFGSFFTPQFFAGKNCLTPRGCVAAATPVGLALGERRELFFPLDGLASLTGRITDDLTGAPIEGVRVVLRDAASGQAVAPAERTDGAGNFGFSRLPAVAVHLLAEKEEYLAEYFDDVDARRGAAAANLILLRPDETETVEIDLEPRGGLTMRARAAESGARLPCFEIRAYPLPVSRYESFEASGCPEDGRLTLPNLAAGMYYVMLVANDRANYLHGKGSCNQVLEDPCLFAQGTPVAVRRGEKTDLGEASLELSASLQTEIRFTAPPGYNKPVGALVHLFDSGGALIRSDYTFPYPWISFGGLVPGDYYLTAEGRPFWQALAYPDVPCGRWYCDPSSGTRIHLEPGEQKDLGDVLLGPSAPYERCTASDTALCLNQGRYKVSATWRDFAGASGAGTARPLTADSGYFYFFSPNNLEVLVKVLNGCLPHLGHHFWVYGAGLTNVQVELRVEDTLTGAFELYSNALGKTFQPILDNAAFATCDAVLPEDQRPTATTELAMQSAEAASSPVDGPAGTDYCGESWPCLAGRFTAEATYRTLGGETGDALGQLVTPDTATYFFFGSYNVELVVKILDACHTGLPGYWVFAAGLTDLEIDLNVTDRATGRSRTYRQNPGPFVPIFDLLSFPCD
jgi:hypothetical protein